MSDVLAEIARKRDEQNAAITSAIKASMGFDSMRALDEATRRNFEMFEAKVSADVLRNAEAFGALTSADRQMRIFAEAMQPPADFISSLAAPMQQSAELLEAFKKSMQPPAELLEAYRLASTSAFALGGADISRFALGLDGLRFPTMGELLGERQAPAVIVQHPEPPMPAAQIEQVRIDPDWREVMDQILRAGKASPKQVIDFLLDRNAGSQQPPAWPEIEALALDYERNGHNYDGLAGFARKHGIHRATIDRYLKMYEAATGRQIRPGRGRQKQRKKS